LPQATKQRRNHPIISYVIGAVFVILSAIVAVGIVLHLTVSSHGPQLLKPLLGMYLAKNKSEILEEAKRLEDLEIHRHFHHIVNYPQLPEKSRPVCYICHSDLPHSKNQKIRSMLNMHTQFFVCETCHIEARKDVGIVYKWYNPLEAHPSGPFFGTRYEPATGDLAPVADRLSKIAPYFKKGDALESAIQIQDAPIAKDYMRVRDKLTPEQRDGVKNKFHEHIKPKGFQCETCHSDKGILDFKELGFGNKRIEVLQNLKIKSVLTNYEEIDLTSLFKQ
jgi:DNA-directed RNA polymerase subunit M/transcription elongation factor TFIIS